MSRRIVLVIGQLHQGGAEGQLVLLARGLADAGDAPSVACLSEVADPHGPLLAARGIPVALFPRRRRRDLGRVRALAAFIRAFSPDVVHSFLVGANAYAYAASRLARRGQLVVSSRTTMRAPSRAARLVHAWIFRHADAVVANAGSVREFTASHYGVPAERIRVVRNGVDLQAYAPAGAREAVRGEWGIPPDAVVVGTLGRLSAEKNVELFVDLAAGLAREFPGLRGVVIGDGPRRPSVEAAVSRAGLDGRVILAGARADVPRVLAALDLFVTASDTEGLPNAAMEAMAAGLPVVATDAGGTREVVAEGVTGRVVPPGRLVPLLEASRPLVRDAALRRRMGEAGRARIASEFGVERMVAATRAVYEEVLRGRIPEAA